MTSDVTSSLYASLVSVGLTVKVRGRARPAGRGALGHSRAIFRIRIRSAGVGRGAECTASTLFRRRVAGLNISAPLLIPLQSMANAAARTAQSSGVHGQQEAEELSV